MPSILEPSKTIKAGYEPVTIATDDGRTVAGLLVEERPDVVVLRDAAQGGKPVTIARSRIEQRRQGGPALMPAGLVNPLASRQQFLVWTLPDNNPWLCQIRPSGFDFLPGGHRAAVCTWDGDVGLVDGIDDPSWGLTWQRIASGLFQPLGLKAVAEWISTTAATELEGRQGRSYTTSSPTTVVAPLKRPRRTGSTGSSAVATAARPGQLARAGPQLSTTSVVASTKPRPQPRLDAVSFTRPTTVSLRAASSPGPGIEQRTTDKPTTDQRTTLA